MNSLVVRVAAAAAAAVLRSHRCHAIVLMVLRAASAHAGGVVALLPCVRASLL